MQHQIEVKFGRLYESKPPLFLPFPTLSPFTVADASFSTPIPHLTSCLVA